MMRRLLVALCLLALPSLAWADGLSPPQNAGIVELGKLIGANFNSTADQAITLALPSPNWIIHAFTVCNPSVSMTTAVGGVYSAAAKGGVQLVAASQVWSGLTTNAVNTVGSCVSAPAQSSALFNVSTIYLSLTTPQGAAATADVYVYGRPLY